MPNTRFARRPFHLIALVLTAVSAGSCATSVTRNVEKAAASVLISTEQENQMGALVKQELETKEGIRYLSDPETVAYVQRVAGKVIAFGKKERPDVKWQVFVIDDRKVVNAFATPGGYLYVYRGLLESVDNEAQLAGVMAHEAGHVVARHSARSLVAAYGLEAVAAAAVGNNPNLIAQLGTAIVSKGLMLSHSRADETEADEYGARFASAAGYDPHGLVSFFAVLKAKEGHTPAVLVYLSDHPATQDRIDYLNRYIAEQHLTGSEEGVLSYRAMRARLVTLPAPPSPTPGAAPGAPPAPAAPAAPAGAPPGAPPAGLPPR